jgi:hypothetical protein
MEANVTSKRRICGVLYASNILKSKGGHVARQIHLWRSTNFSFAFSLPFTSEDYSREFKAGYDQCEEGVPQAGTILALRGAGKGLN